MSTDTFRAAVQYDDLTGSSAADRADKSDATDWLKARGLMGEDEFLVGYDVHVSPVLFGAGNNVAISTTFLLAKAQGLDNFAEVVKASGPIPLRRVQQDLTPNEFFSLFKRFNITLSSGGVLEGREYTY
ncbi:hypothetical protein [Stenotrophomonas sp.]|uniref:hypothetical protein n=1 Tax=Stenotrophomonas sp. TaxID=69392 RepID=UPI0028AD3BBB|nr:hypothetical protein [Stenotrophomonas sp.]